MTLASEHAEAASTHCTQPSTPPHVPRELQTPSPPSVRATSTAAEDTTDTAPQNSVNESMAFQEHTMVDDDAEQLEFTERRGSIGADTENGIVDSDPPVRPTHFTADPKEVQDVTVVEEEADVVDSNGHALYPNVDAKRILAISKRTSHLRLDLKPPSPQPWDIIQPTNEESSKDERGFYSAEPLKFQSARLTRPLIPKSSYYFGPPPPDSAFGSSPTGQIGVHHPREVIRIERDYTGGELVQFAPIYPLELEGRINPTQFLESINAINELLISAHSIRHSFVDNLLAVFSLQLSKLILSSHYEKEMERLRYLFDDLNAGLYNPVGLNILWPRDVAFLFLEIEYYVSNDFLLELVLIGELILERP